MQSQISEIQNLVALFIVQILGILSGLIGTFNLTNSKEFCKSSTNIGIPKRDRMMAVIFVVLIISVGSIVCHGHIYPILLRWGDSSSVPSEPAKPWPGLPFSGIVCVYALMDLGVLAYLISKTGGSRQSLFVPYLLIIVPVAVILQDSKILIGIYFLTTVAIFWLCLSRWKNTDFQVTNEVAYNKSYGLITTLCVFLPTFLKVVGLKMIVH